MSDYKALDELIEITFRSHLATFDFVNAAELSHQAAAELEQLHTELSRLQTRNAELEQMETVLDKAKWNERIDILRKISVELLKYGASYFLGAPMEKFSRWIQSQLIETERAYAAFLAAHPEKEEK